MSTARASPTGRTVGFASAARPRAVPAARLRPMDGPSTARPASTNTTAIKSESSVSWRTSAAEVSSGGYTRIAAATPSARASPRGSSARRTTSAASARNPTFMRVNARGSSPKSRMVTPSASGNSGSRYCSGWPLPSRRPCPAAHARAGSRYPGLSPTTRAGKPSAKANATPTDRRTGQGAAFKDHDGVHAVIVRTRRTNDLLAELLLAWPVLVPFRSYRHVHRLHHRHLGTERDPDFARNRPERLGRRGGAMEFARIMLGLNAEQRGLLAFFAWGDGAIETE